VCRPKHVEQLRNIGIINSTTRSHLVGSFYEICRCGVGKSPPLVRYRAIRI